MPDGATCAQHLRVAWKSSGRMPRELDIDPLPHSVAGLWEFYLMLRLGVHSGMGASTVSWADIEACQRAMGVQLNPWEVETLLRMDAAAAAAASGKKPESMNGD